MDFSKFSDEDFDIKEWINSTFTAQKDTNQNAEQYAGTLVTKLQVFIQEINNCIDETSQQTVQNFPRILREIDVLKQESFMLKEQMKNVRVDLIKVEKITVNDSMKLLLDLDIMRTNILSIQNALQEADNWSTLTADLDSILLTRDENKISQHIKSMQNSLTLLQDDSGEYVNRCTLLENFKNRFETSLSADIISALNSKSTESVKSYVEIFRQMNRLDELKKYYYQCEKMKIIEVNKQLIAEVIAVFNKNSSVDEKNVTFCLEPTGIQQVGDSLNCLLKNWLDNATRIWHDENQWCKQIFNDNHEIVINLLIKCFEDFNRNYLQLLEKFSSMHGNDEYFLVYLNQLKQETDHFTLIINSSAENLAIFKTSQLTDLLFKLFQQVYSPYKSYSIRYTNVTVKHFQYQLENNIKMSHTDTVECVQLLCTSVGKVFTLIDQEMDRCQTLTNGCGFAMLVEALKIFLKSYVEEFKRVIVNLKERNTKQEIVKTKGHRRSTSSPHNILSTKSDENDFEDWDAFRHFVKIIQIVGELITKYDCLEDLLNKNIQKSLARKNSAGSSEANLKQELGLLSIESYKQYLLEDTDRMKLNSFIHLIESGDDYSIMKDLLRPLYSLSESVHKFAFDIVFAPVKHLLKNISKSTLWTKKESDQASQNIQPLFAFAPQEYITKIGQYLLTLPQNFEPFTMQGNDHLIVALQKGKLPYLDSRDLTDDITSCWLDSIANATAIVFSEEILNIQVKIPANSQRQLIIDIEFICSVFEDFGLKEYTNLLSILELLKITETEFQDSCKNKPARIVSAIKKMRNF